MTLPFPAPHVILSVVCGIVALLLLGCLLVQTLNRYEVPARIWSRVTPQATREDYDCAMHTLANLFAMLRRDVPDFPSEIWLRIRFRNITDRLPIRLSPKIRVIGIGSHPDLDLDYHLLFKHALDRFLAGKGLSQLALETGDLDYTLNDRIQGLSSHEELDLLDRLEALDLDPSRFRRSKGGA